MSTHIVKKVSNSFSTGGGGVNFEESIQAFFLLTLLTDVLSPIINKPTKKIYFQAKRLGYDTDDLVVVAGTGTEESRLLCQIKHMVRATKSNAIFQEVMLAAWSDFRKDSFNKENDRIVIITGNMSITSMKSLKFLNEQASVTTEENDFLERIKESNYSSEQDRAMFNTIKECLKKANNAVTPSDYDLWIFCKVFTLLLFDLDYLYSVNRTLAISLIECKSNADPILVWARLIECAGRYNQSSAIVDINNIDSNLKSYFKSNIISLNIPTSTLDYNDFLCKLVIIGSWREDNLSDKETIEKITEMKYSDFEKKAHEMLVSNPDYITLTNGAWNIKYRERLFSKCNSYIFDSIVQRLFQEGKAVFSQNNMRIELGTAAFLSTHQTEFRNSFELRKGLAIGMCLISINRLHLNYCNKKQMEAVIHSFFEELFYNCNWLRWASLGDCLLEIIEINPSLYLHVLEKDIVENPNEILKLFPKASENNFGQKNYISEILWSLEVLAWFPNFLLRVIRCLGLMEELGYEKTNWSNTPINSIISILLPWYSQTMADMEKKKSALVCLCKENSELVWHILYKLLPEHTSTATNNPRPKFLDIKIPKEIKISYENLNIELEIYMAMALDIAKGDIEKLSMLANDIKHMNEEILNKYLKSIEDVISEAEEEEKFELWLHLDEAIKIEKNKGLNLKQETHEYIEKILNLIKPEDIFQKYRKLYLGKTFLWDKGDYSTIRECLEEKKKKAISELFSKSNFIKVNEFAISVKDEYDVGRKLGGTLTIDEIAIAIKNFNEGEINKLFFKGIINSFCYKEGVRMLLSMEWKDYNEKFILDVLSMIPYSSDLLSVANILIENISKFWEIALIPYSFLEKDNNGFIELIKNLMKYKRYITAVNLAGHSELYDELNSEIVYELLEKAGTKKSIGIEKFDSYAIENLIGWLQKQKLIDIEQLSDIEFIYLPFLDEYSEIKPHAIMTRLSEDPEFFCSLIEMFFKKRSESEFSVKINEAVSKRLASILYNFKVVPGKSWNGDFSEEKFTNWIQYVKQWSIENDRYAVCMHTIGSGLSHADLDNDGTPNDAIMRELNHKDNNEMRRGYRIGIINQRGVHTIDPSGKPEFRLADKYDTMAENVEQKGYSRYSQILHDIADEYRREAEQNIEENKLMLENS